MASDSASASASAEPHDAASASPPNAHDHDQTAAARQDDTPDRQLVVSSPHARDALSRAHDAAALAHDTPRPAKRRKLEDPINRIPARAVSPPWKSFAADGPTTIFDNGVRKSSRVNKEPPPSGPGRRKRRSDAKTPQANGTPKSSSKYLSRRSASGPVPSSKGRWAQQSVKAPPPSPSRKSERHRRPSAAALAATPTVPVPVPQGTLPVIVKRRPGRPPKIPRPLLDDTTAGAHDASASRSTRSHDVYSTPRHQPNFNSPPTRLRLRMRKLDPPNRHPRHAPPKHKFSSFADWLQQDDPLEGEDGQRVTRDKAQEEAQRRLKVVDAAETGVLSAGRCSVFQPEPAEEPPPQYGHWDHVIAHAMHFNKLLRDEKTYHRRVAKALAREAHDYWRNKFKRKTQEEVDAEEAERALTRYKQLVRDVRDAWGFVRTEIDKERVARWEEEQLQLGHKAMDDMFIQAQEILGRNAPDSASSFVSDDRDTDGDGDDFGSERSDDEHEEDDENMTSSSESDVERGNDEDANLTAEQLRAKYEQLPDLSEASSRAGSEDEEQDEAEEEGVEIMEAGDEEDDEEEEEKEEGEREEEEEDDIDEVGDESRLQAVSNERTPEPTPDPDLELENDGSSDGTPVYTNGHNVHASDEDEDGVEFFDPANIELEHVDEALLDSEADGEEGSDSGSEAWSSNDEEEDDEEADDAEEDVVRSDSGSEDDGDDAGVMGFLAPNDIAKLKAAARAVVDGQTEDVLMVSENVNGHQKPCETELDEVAHEDELHVNGNGTVHSPEPSIEPETGESSVVEQLGTHGSRSRGGSSPPRTEVPHLLRGTLREYQHDGLDWLANLHKNSTNGILADEMGLGKTIQTISLLAYMAADCGNWGPHLVVVPTSVMLNWEMEFKKWCPGFKILTYYGDISERKRKRIGWRNMGRDMINVVITSYQLILQDAAAFKMRAWQYLILDEAHNIKNFKSQRWQTMLNLRTEHRLLLTGTPLQNNIDELWSLLYFLMPAGFAGEGRIANLEEFTMALKNPTSQILDQGRQQLDVEAQRIVKKLHEVLRPYLLRRLKADVEKQMPGKYEHVVYCKLSKRQRQLYDGFMGRASTREILSSGNYMSIINCLMSLRKVCNHPDLFETRAIVTSMAMPKSVAAQFEIKDLLIRKRLQEGSQDRINLDALNLVFARREQTSLLHARRSQQIRATRPLRDLIERQTRRLKQPTEPATTPLQAQVAARATKERVAARDKLQMCLDMTRWRTLLMPVYGQGLVDKLTMNYEDYAFGAREPDEIVPRYVAHAPYQPYTRPLPLAPSNPFEQAQFERSRDFEVRPGRRGRLGFRQPLRPALASAWYQQHVGQIQSMVKSVAERAEALAPLVARFTCVTPAVAADELAPLTLSKPTAQLVRSSDLSRDANDPFHEARMRQSIAFPDRRLLQYDCGKLQRLASLLRDLQAGGHRALIFTQMTKVLDILEQFLNIHGHRYLRLDGATRVEQRQILTDRFNSDPKILCFILSSRSGGLGINLTGADTVIFYDLDWNPAMDKQCQDRSHRIGQTRDVHIYKFVSEYTIEANILRKSNQKRLLDDIIIQKGDFTTDAFNRVTWRDALDDGETNDKRIDVADEAGAAMDRVLGEKAGLLGDARLMSGVEDTEDRAAASVAQKEIVDEIRDDQVDFNESLAAARGDAEKQDVPEDDDAPVPRGLIKGDRLNRGVDEYMLERFRDEFGTEPWRPPTERQKRYRKGADVHRVRGAGGRKKKGY